MLVIQVLITAIVATVIVGVVLYCVFETQIKSLCSLVKNRLSYEKKLSEALLRSDKKLEADQRKATREARREIEESSLYIGKKGDTNCP